MIKPKILITGATGKTGTALVAELVKREWPVRAMVSREDGRSANLQRLGAEVVAADLYDPEQLMAAAKGTQRAYYLPLMRPYMIQAAAAFAVAAGATCNARHGEQRLRRHRPASSFAHHVLHSRLHFAAGHLTALRRISW